LECNIKIIIFTIFLSSLVWAQEYSHIDQHVLNTPKSAEYSIKSLATYLTKPARNERDKVRAIFRWVTENIKYDVDSFYAGRTPNSSPENVLQSKKAVCEGYSGLFKNLADEAGLQTTVIQGYAKGVRYTVGDTFTGLPNHAWNAVKIDGKWYLLDPTWGAGYINNKREYQKKFRDYYYFTPPDKLKFTHFPIDSKWQLISKPISKEEFEDLVFVKSYFFEYGLELKNHLNAEIKVNDQLSVDITGPRDVLLKAVLIHNRKKLNKSFTFTQRKGKEIRINAVFPSQDEYILRFFAKSKNKPKEHYDWVLDYKVQAKVDKRRMVGFPTTFKTFSENDAFLFGPMEGYLKYGSQYIFKISISNVDAVVILINNQLTFMENKNGYFEKKIKVNGDKVGVLVKFPTNQQDSYSYLLQYKTY
jgi:kyphoscoliosis peptidase